MSFVDALLAGASMAVACGLVCGCRWIWRRLVPSFAVLAGLAVLQVLLEGFYWQFLPGYAILLTTGLLAVAGKDRCARVWRPLRLLGRAGMAGVAGAALTVWTFLPVPRLTPPGGRYAVGTEVFRWVDPSREEPATTDSADRRNVIVQAWYPTAAARGVPSQRVHSQYIDGLDRLPAFVTLIPRFVLRRFDRIDTNAVPGAPISGDRRQWPVVLFSPGYGAPRAFYTSLVTGLASRGYVVLALDHPYEAAVTELADGRIATTVERFDPADRDRSGFMREHLAIRAADVRFVLDQLNRPGTLGKTMDGRLDLAHVGIAGHSFGGATAAAALAGESRLAAGVNIDGTLYGAVPDQHLEQPFLLLESDYGETRHSKKYLTGNEMLLRNLSAAGYRYEVRRANHYSFTDAPLFLSPPARFALARVIGGGRGPVETHRVTAELLAAFFQGPLMGVEGDLQAVAGRYLDVAGGAVK